MTPGEQRRKALELLAPPPSRRHECLRDIEYALDWVSGPARTAFKIFGSKEGRAGLRRYASALRRALAAYQNLHPRIRPWFSITETAYIVGQPTHLHREIAKAEAILDRPSSSSRAAQHKAAVFALGTCEFRKSFGTVAATIDGVGHHSCSKRPPTAAVVWRGLRGFSDGLRDHLAPFSV